MFALVIVSGILCSEIGPTSRPHNLDSRKYCCSPVLLAEYSAPGIGHIQRLQPDMEVLCNIHSQMGSRDHKFHMSSLSHPHSRGNYMHCRSLHVSELCSRCQDIESKALRKQRHFLPKGKWLGSCRFRKSSQCQIHLRNFQDSRKLRHSKNFQRIQVAHQESNSHSHSRMEEKRIRFVRKHKSQPLQGSDHMQ